MLQRCSCNFPLAFGPFKCADFGAFWRCLRNDDAEWWPQLQGDVLQERFSGRRGGMLLLFLNAMIHFAASQGFSGCRHRSVPATAILTASLWLVAEIGPLLRGRFESRHQLGWIEVDRVHVDVHAPILEVDCVIFLAEEPSRFMQLGNVMYIDR